MKYAILFIVGIIATSCMETGRSTEQYFDLSNQDVTRLTTAASYDHGEAALRLGQYYSGSKHDMNAAAQWYKRSAEAGNAQGMYNLGLYYISDTSEPQHNHLARFWLQKAKESGEPLAGLALKSLASD